jgi:putative zinc finger/helix-turn-helix YgiT family protein
MTCFECGCETLAIGEVELPGERNGQNFAIKMVGLKCSNCGFQTIDSEQSAEFTKLVSDAYRVANGLLTSAEIVAARTRLGMNQQQFGEHLGTGPASVKRWEVGKVQERSMDELIRLKTDPGAMRRLLKELERQVPEQQIVSVFEGDDIGLSFVVESQQYNRKPSMRIDESGLLPLTGDEDVPLAA